MPLLGGDSNRFWRFDLKLMFQGFGLLLLLRGFTLLMGIYPRYIPVFDDIIKVILQITQWLAVSFNRFASTYMAF